MSTMSMFFVAPPADVPSQQLHEGVPAVFPSVRCGYIDELKVASLEGLLTGKDPSEAAKSLANQVVFSHAESGITALRLGDELTKALASQSSESALEPAKKWLATNQWGRFGRREGDLGELAAMIVAIGKLASVAVSESRGLFLWVCP
jgi:hypothetical protein